MHLIRTLSSRRAASAGRNPRRQAGITYTKLQSFNEFLIDTKRREILRRRTGLPL
jgi:hypothetical protein